MRSLFLKGALAVLFAGVLFSLLVLWNRDTTKREIEMQRMAVIRDAIQQVYHQRGELPAVFPPVTWAGPEIPARRFQYVGVDEIEVLRELSGPVMVGSSKWLGSAIREDGRIVLLEDDGEFSLRWMNVGEFRRFRQAQTERIEQFRRNLLR